MKYFFQFHPNMLNGIVLEYKSEQSTFDLIHMFLHSGVFSALN